jgi:predicted PurR-regulated permease PerM
METSRSVTDQAIVSAAKSLAFRRHLRFWLLIAALIVLFLWVFSDILLPFAAGIVLAYFLDPVADWLERKGCSRALAASLILFSFIAVFVIALVTLVPLIARQMAEFATSVPGLIAQLQQLITSFNPEWLTGKLGINPDDLRNAMNSIMSAGIGVASSIFKSIWSSASSLFSLAGLFVVTPVVAFYMLVDWDRMIARLDSWVPRNNVETVRRLATEINASTAGFVRGQSLDGLILGVMYSVALSAIGLNFAVLVGMLSGLIGFIPYVGSAVGLVLATGIALAQFWPEWQWVLAVVVIFAAGQFIEGNFIQPRLVGQSVGLHPVWLMFSLFAFGALFGFVGLLIAVPAAAAIGVLVRFAISRYLESPLFTGAPDALVEVGHVDIVDARQVAAVKVIDDSPKRRKPARK